MTLVKVCGLKTHETVNAALEAGADFLGFVFFPKSPRHIDIGVAKSLVKRVNGHARSVALSVDQDLDTLKALLDEIKVDAVQLHGRETPDYIRALKSDFKGMVIKAANVVTPEERAGLKAFEPCIDWFLFDAPAPEQAERPGGNGRMFDWKTIKTIDIESPFMLSGGLTIENVASAIDQVHPDGVDVSSGVEHEPGVKSPEKIAQFVAAAHADTSNISPLKRK